MSSWPSSSCASARALRALPEPQRATLVRHFLRDESLSAIARAEGLAVATVHERLQRGLAELRRQLDAEHGGERRAWAIALVALARRPVPIAGPWQVVMMTSTWKVVAATVALVSAGLFGWQRLRPVGPVPAVAVGESSAVPELSEPAAASMPPVPAARVELPSAPAPQAPAAKPPESWRGRVLDLAGAPVAGVALELEGGARTTSAADGTFMLAQGDSAEPRIWCTAAHLLTLVGGAPRAAERIVVVAPRVDFAGQVVDETGAPVPGARLQFHLRDSLFRELGLQVWWPAQSTAWSTNSVAGGTFELPGLAGGRHVGLEVSAPGFRAREVELAPQGERLLRVELAHAPGTLLVRGTVLGPTREPFSGARVSGGGEPVTTDAAGRFTLASPAETGRYRLDAQRVWRAELDPELRVVALAPGFAPATFVAPRAEAPAEVVLVLSGAPPSISGTVRDSAGEPLPGIAVWPRQLSDFGREERLFVGIPHEFALESELAGTSSRQFGAVTDAAGRFTLANLAARTYDLEFFDARRAWHATREGVEAGREGLEVVLAPAADMRRVAGRVVDAEGRPQVGVCLQPVRVRTDGSRVEPPELAGVARAGVTDAAGHFEFEALVCEGTLLAVEAMPPFEVELAGRADLTTLELTVPTLCELQVLLADPESADRLDVFDAAGRELDVLEHLVLEGRGATFASGPGTALIEGRSSVIRVPSTARTLVLFHGDQRVLEHPLVPDPARPTVLRF